MRRSRCEAGAVPQLYPSTRVGGSQADRPSPVASLRGKGAGNERGSSVPCPSGRGFFLAASDRTDPSGEDDRRRTHEPQTPTPYLFGLHRRNSTYDERVRRRGIEQQDRDAIGG